MTDKCAGVCVRGYRRGEPCGAVPKYMVRGKMYCGSHYPVAAKEPKRFREAVEAFVRGEARREMQRRSAAKQLDAFPDIPTPMTGEAAAVYEPVYQHPGKSDEFNELDQFYRDQGM
jgi:hypothetical protein